MHRLWVRDLDTLEPPRPFLICVPKSQREVKLESTSDVVLGPPCNRCQISDRSCWFTSIQFFPDNINCLHLWRSEIAKAFISHLQLDLAFIVVQHIPGAGNWDYAFKQLGRDALFIKHGFEVFYDGRSKVCGRNSWCSRRQTFPTSWRFGAPQNPPQTAAQLR